MKTILLFILLTANSTAGFADAAPSDITMRTHMSPSPDGQQKVYHARGPKMAATLFVSNIDGSNETLLHGTGTTIEQEPRWSPDGKWIAFVAGTAYEKGNLQIHVIRPDGTDVRKLTNTKEGMTKGPSWSPDSSQILYEVRDSKAGITSFNILDLKSGQNRKLVESIDDMLVQPEWSPDGASILFATRDPQSQGSSDLWIMSLKHPDHRRRITRTDEGETMPIWAPDGEAIVFSKPSDETGQHDLYFYRFKDKSLHQLTETPDTQEYFPIFSADGKHLYFDTFQFNGKAWGSTGNSLKLPPALR